jgi:hypothetical protein
MPSPRVLGAAAVLALSAVVLSACGSSAAPPAPEETTTATSPAPPAPQPSSTSEPDPASAEEPTCATLIGEAVVADFESVGWSVRAEPLYIGSVEIPDGLTCVWADFSSPAGDHGQMFGWGPLDADRAAEVQDELVSQGWVREQTTEGVYITESAETAIAVDENGYGMTYLFGEGWVEFADTKQGLLLIEWPAS